MKYLMIRKQSEDEAKDDEFQNQFARLEFFAGLFLLGEWDETIAFFYYKRSLRKNLLDCFSGDVARLLLGLFCRLRYFWNFGLL